ncbi:MAG: glutamine synthetase III [Bacteroidetes bacterium]|jgi:glutamine synthetase|nr:glutamine synthetase III [Bacteroidota bacterium]
MTNPRFSAVQAIAQHTFEHYSRPKAAISDYFAELVFNDETLEKWLSPPHAKQMLRCIHEGEKMDADLADAVATGMRNWAMSHGATHFTHWFHPLRGTTAEKHDTFFELKGNTPLETFRGSALVQQEPDASSFPSGGIRSTFEARGYTAWDPTSPAFIYETALAKTLCIPTVFVAYTGQALDHKAPLLKAIEAIDKAATRVCQLFDRQVNSVKPSLGIEQEYFLVDRNLYLARPDLVMCGRTVFGHAPARGQQLSDHYFGSIPRRVTNFMVEFETEAHRLGIPVRTRHNEVAPGQFEVAPQFEEANLAIDHNMLLMDIMERLAEKHHFKVLFHEKPFKGINGSGKHNNWSLITDQGKNLLSPSSKPKENLQFLTFLVCTIQAVHRHADLLRASIASASNDLRLGAHEAPPAIVSVFLGRELTRFLSELEKNDQLKVQKGDNVYLKLGISKLPEILLDNTDRNRTSPFAFTGNKFEFRAVGSLGICSDPMTTLNAAVAEVLNDFAEAAEKQLELGLKREEVVLKLLRSMLKSSKSILFEGDNYAEAWKKEAEKRGLPNTPTTPEALDALLSKKAKQLFKNLGIFSAEELEARTLILLEEYILKIQIEARIGGDLAQNHIIPTAIKYQHLLVQHQAGLQQLGLADQGHLDYIKEMSLHIHQVQLMVQHMTEARKSANAIEDTREKAKAYCNEVRPFIDKIRYHVDKLELMIDDADWPLPKYRELLFLR